MLSSAPLLASYPAVEPEEQTRIYTCLPRIPNLIFQNSLVDEPPATAMPLSSSPDPRQRPFHDISLHLESKPLSPLVCMHRKQGLSTCSCPLWYNSRTIPSLNLVVPSHPYSHASIGEIYHRTCHIYRIQAPIPPSHRRDSIPVMKTRRQRAMSIRPCEGLQPHSALKAWLPIQPARPPRHRTYIQVEQHHLSPNPYGTLLI